MDRMMLYFERGGKWWFVEDYRYIQVKGVTIDFSYLDEDGKEIHKSYDLDKPNSVQILDSDWDFDTRVEFSE